VKLEVYRSLPTVRINARRNGAGRVSRATPSGASEVAMKVLLSSIGSRGDVQPLLGLAHELRNLGQDCVFCVAPTFQEWVESHGFACIPVGPNVRPKPGPRSGPARWPTRAQIKKGLPDWIRELFRVSTAAAHLCDLILVGNGIQVAGRSVAEHRKIPYVFVTYCAGTLPSPRHPPPRVPPQRLPAWINWLLWKASQRTSGLVFRDVLNDERRKLGLLPVDDVTAHVTTERPWVASDASLGPSDRAGCVQTGAWLLRAEAALPDDLERFLERGDPPVYCGLGSMMATADTARALVEAVRSSGRRIVLSRGWAELRPPDAGDDCISVGDVDHARLFPRVAAIVHHGGAGTTTAAALAGRPQVVVPHNYDQFYWAERVRSLGIGVRGPGARRLTARRLAGALEAALKPGVAEKARSFAPRMDTRGALAAARRIVREFG
jgi:vancomycin aglycone glucosyltransferase